MEIISIDTAVSPETKFALTELIWEVVEKLRVLVESVFS